jgi:hypothetical protein
MFDFAVLTATSSAIAMFGEQAITGSRKAASLEAMLVDSQIIISAAERG